MQKGSQVAFAGMGVNFALGILYAWSIFAAALRDELGWTATESQLPYMLGCCGTLPARSRTDIPD